MNLFGLKTGSSYLGGSSFMGSSTFLGSSFGSSGITILFSPRRLNLLNLGPIEGFYSYLGSEIGAAGAGGEIYNFCSYSGLLGLISIDFS